VRRNCDFGAVSSAIYSFPVFIAWMQRHHSIVSGKR
jgi:hypothetical protein